MGLHKIDNAVVNRLLPRLREILFYIFAAEQLHIDNLRRERHAVRHTANIDGLAVYYHRALGVGVVATGKNKYDIGVPVH